MFSSPLSKFSSKNFFLVVSEIFRLFVNILTPNGKLSLSVKTSVYWYQFKCNFLQNPKRFLDFSLRFWHLHQISNIIKRWASQLIYFRSCRRQNPSLLICLKSPLSQHLSIVNMLKGPKHSWNLHRTSLVMLFDQSERRSVQKILRD